MPLKSQRNQPPSMAPGMDGALAGSEAAELAASFVEESLALIEQANAALLTLEADPDDREAINALFRSVHSIKGAAGLFDLPALIHLVHAGEDLLGAVRDGKLRVDAAMADELLAGLDYVTRWIGMFQAHGALPPEKMDIARRFAAAYRARLDAIAPAASTPEAGPEAVPEPGVRHAWAEAARATLAGDAVGVSVEYTPDEGCFFSGEDPLRVALATPGLAWLDIAPREAWPERARFDPYACNLRVRLIACADRAEVEHHFRYMPECVTLAAPAPAPESAAAPAPAIVLPPLAVELLDEVRLAHGVGVVEDLVAHRARGRQALAGQQQPGRRHLVARHHDGGAVALGLVLDVGLVEGLGDLTGLFQVEVGIEQRLGFAEVHGHGEQGRGDARPDPEQGRKAAQVSTVHLRSSDDRVASGDD